MLTIVKTSETGRFKMERIINVASHPTTIYYSLTHRGDLRHVARCLRNRIICLNCRHCQIEYMEHVNNRIRIHMYCKLHGFKQWYNIILSQSE